MLDFLTGILLVVCTMTGLSRVLMRVVPGHVKLAIVVGMGLLIAMIGMVSVNLVVASGDDSLVMLGDLSDWRIWIAFGGTIVTASLIYHEVEGGILAGIIAASLVFFAVTGDWPDNFVDVPEFNWNNYIDNINFKA